MTDTSPHANYWEDRARDLNKRLAERSAEAEALRQVVKTYGEMVLSILSDNKLYPLWKRIANQRIALRQEIATGQSYMRANQRLYNDRSTLIARINVLTQEVAELRAMKREEHTEDGVLNTGFSGNMHVVEALGDRDWHDSSLVDHERKVITYTGPWVKKNS